MESIPATLQDLLSQLEFLSMIKRGTKPCFSDMTFVSSDSWLGAWKRHISGESRKNLLFEITQTLDKAIFAIEEYSNTPYLYIIIDSLSKTKTGIENLILTYSNHPDTVSKLRIMIMRIDMVTQNYQSSNVNKKTDPIPVLIHRTSDETMNNSFKSPMNRCSSPMTIFSTPPQNFKDLEKKVQSITSSIKQKEEEEIQQIKNIENEISKKEIEDKNVNDEIFSKDKNMKSKIKKEV